MRYTLLLLSFFMFGINSWSQEICDNGIDDDGDGLIDLNDVDDCDCATQIPSLIPNGSFEDMNCCPSSYSELYCAESWIQASSATSDYMNSCGFLMPAMVAANLVPMPDGEGSVGAIIAFDDLVGENYVEYVGACTNAPMLAGQSYTMTFYIASAPISPMGDECGGGVIFYEDIDITLYGNPDCSSIPWFGNDCPTSSGPNWEILGSVNYTPLDSWAQVQISFTPSQDINTISLGAPCTLPASYIYSGGCYPYFYYDGLTLRNSTPVVVVHDQSDCNYGVLQASTDTTGGTWQWYSDGVALVGQTDSILDLDALDLEDGTYTVVYTVGTECEGSSANVPYIGPNSTSIDEVSCESFYWEIAGDTLTESGIYSEILQNVYGCDSTIFLDLAIAQNYDGAIDTTICSGEQVVIFGVGYDQPGFYFDTFSAASGCDSTISLTLFVVDKPAMPILSAIYPECATDDIILTAEAEVGYNVLWTGPSGYQGVGYQETVEVSQEYSGIFSAVVSNQGCLSDSAYLTINSEYLIFNDFDVPNVITSNQDGVNEYIDIRDYYQGCAFKFTVVDRWGITVFEQTENSAPFSGRDKSGRKLKEGTYFYTLEYDEDTKHGFIQVVK